jgi:putative hydrolase of the HAD superfamily
MLVEALASIGFDLPRDVMDHVVALDHSAYSNSLQTDPDVMATLAALQGAGYRMGIVSNMTLMWNLMREDLERVGMLGFFDATVFSSEVGVRKPDPRIFREALGRIGAEPTETVFVGDRLYDDVTGAQGVGMRAVQTRQFSREVDPTISPDAAIERLSELPAVLQTWGGPPIA